MWIFDDISVGFSDIAVGALSLSRVMLGFAILWKVAWEQRWGGYHYFDSGTLTRWRYDRVKRHLKLVPSPRAYRVLYAGRGLAALCFFAGIQAPICAAYLSIWFAFEFTFDRKFHTQFLCLFCGLFALDSSYGGCLGYGSLVHTGRLNASEYCDGSARSTALPSILMVLTVWQMYWSSVRHKIISRQFLSGDVLQKTSEHFDAIREDMPYREVRLPSAYYNLFARGEAAVVRRRWRPFAVTTLSLEACLPILLLCRPLLWVGVSLGVLMHVCMAGLFPKRLAPYSIACMASYVLFFDPSAVSHFLSYSV